MPAVVRGLREIEVNLKAMRTNVVASVAEEQRLVGNELLLDLKRRTSFPFQTVPSYLRESQFKNRKNKHFDTDIPVFSTEAPSLKGTPWEGQVQFYEKPQHLLHELLVKEDHLDGTYIVTEVGYDKGVGKEGPTRYISWVIYGTHKMQGRNFIRIAFKSFIRDFKRAVARGVRQALQTTVLTGNFYSTDQPSFRAAGLKDPYFNQEGE